MDEADNILSKVIIDQAQTETIAQDLSDRLRKLEAQLRDKDIEAPPEGEKTFSGLREQDQGAYGGMIPGPRGAGPYHIRV